MKEGDKLILRRNGSENGVYMTIPNTRLMLRASEEDFREFCEKKRSYIPFEVVDRDGVFREINIRIGGNRTIKGFKMHIQSITINTSNG